MTERDNLIASIVATTADYRKGELDPPSTERVAKWVCQFDTDKQIPILREIDHVLKKTYFSKNKVEDFLKTVMQNKNLVGSDPRTFWKNAKFLKIQGGGKSQIIMLKLFEHLLQKEYNLRIDDCGENSNTFVYLDDAIFSGGRVRHDLSKWIDGDAPNQATVHVIVIAMHESSYYSRREICEEIQKTGKSITIKYWRSIMLEDRKAHIDQSDVLCPTHIPDHDATQDYANAMQPYPNLRKGENIGKNSIFSSNVGREILEIEFLKAGVKIMNAGSNWSKYQRPLGMHVLETLGFGSLVVTFGNCPNNTPLALWAGPPAWEPLFPRRNNADSFGIDLT